MEYFQTAVSFDWDTLGPLIFIGVAVLAQLANKLKKKGDSPEDEPEVDAEERARRIREEIRRKIQERKQAEEVESRPLGHPPRQRGYDPTVSERQQRSPLSAQPASTLQPQSASQLKPVAQKPMPTATQRAPAKAGSSLEDRLHAQLKVLERSKQKQKEAVAQAHRMKKAALAGRANVRGSGKTVTVTTGGSFRDQLVAGLRHPDSIRKAVLYREILGPPLGLR